MDQLEVHWVCALDSHLQMLFHGYSTNLKLSGLSGGVRTFYLPFIIEAAAVEHETIVKWLQHKHFESNIVPGAHVMSIWCPCEHR